MDRKNYLNPVVAVLASDRDVDFEVVSLDLVLHAVKGRERCVWSFWMRAATIHLRQRCKVPERPVRSAETWRASAKLGKAVYGAESDVLEL